MGFVDVKLTNLFHQLRPEVREDDQKHLNHSKENGNLQQVQEVARKLEMQCE